MLEAKPPDAISEGGMAQVASRSRLGTSPEIGPAALGGQRRFPPPSQEAGWLGALKIDQCKVSFTAGGLQAGLRTTWAPVVGGAAQKIFQDPIHSATLSTGKGTQSMAAVNFGAHSLDPTSGELFQVSLQGHGSEPDAGAGWGGHSLLRNTELGWEEAKHP